MLSPAQIYSNSSSVDVRQSKRLGARRFESLTKYPAILLALLSLPSIASAQEPLKRVVFSSVYESSLRAAVTFTQVVTAPSFWDQYKWWVAGAAIGAVIEALLIVWLLVVQKRNGR